jgi:hypothetical protein
MWERSLVSEGSWLEVDKVKVSSNHQKRNESESNIKIQIIIKWIMIGIHSQKSFQWNLPSSKH